MTLDTLIALGAAGSLLAIFALLLWRYRVRQDRDEAAFAENKESKRHLPASLHPVIDTELCIGSLSCIKACPEGDILGVIDGSARLVHGSNCIGHGRCAIECPVGAIKLVFGSSERGVDLPEVDEYYESSRRGVHVVGELGGMGLVKNAMRQGILAADRIAEVLAGTAAAPGFVDVAIVGSGPAGIATALGCHARGLTFRLLDQDRFGGTVAHYPRQKLVMTETIELPLVGKFGKPELTKEDLMASFEKIRTLAGLHVFEQVKVDGLTGEDGAFEVLSTKGPLKARKVVLAIGRRGTPRKVGCPGENLHKVTYSLHDPEQYVGCDVIVVGGGDSALEAANACAEAGVRTTLTYRGPALARARPKNIDKTNALVAAGKLEMLLSTELDEIDERQVKLKTPTGSRTVPNDYIIACLGGELPFGLLEKCGVSIKKSFGDVEAKAPAAGRGSAKPEELESGRKRLAGLLFVLGAIVIGSLAAIGWDYYLTPEDARRTHALHEWMRPAGIWGHGVGVVATLFMMSNFLYPIRKRAWIFKGRKSIRSWLTFHVFVGFMSPLVIAFHAAFQSNNLLATATTVSLLIVVTTGIIGRYVYGLIPARGGGEEELADLLARWERAKARLLPLADRADDPASVRAVLESATKPTAKTLLGALIRLPFELLAVRLQAARLRTLFPKAEDFAEFAGELRRMPLLRAQAGFFKGLKRLMSGWRLLHALLASFLVLVIAAHVGLSLYLGYGWILF